MHTYFCTIIYKCFVSGFNKEASFHTLPKDRNLRKQWEIKLKTGTRSNNHSVVCNKHLTENDFAKTMKSK